jgi:hypothetical protein
LRYTRQLNFQLQPNKWASDQERAMPKQKVHIANYDLHEPLWLPIATKLRAHGWSYKDIALICEVHRTTVGAWLDPADRQRRRTYDRQKAERERASD